ncbi:MAG: hypothetical protein AAF206_01755 [Bacteroidota bacterium]
MTRFTIFCLSILFWSCQSPARSAAEDKQAIIETLKQETQYFCERNLAQWQAQWSHRDFVSKMYTGSTTFEEFIGWAAINQFTVDHIQQHPEPIQVPQSSPSYEMTIFQETALVFYTKEGENGPIREVRFMVREDGKWKIGGMQTIF